MRRGLLLAVVLNAGLGGCMSPPAAPDTVAGPAEAEAGPIQDRAQLWWVPVRPYLDSDATFLLETMVYRPSGPGPFPLVTINHGLPIDKTRLRTTRPGFESA